MWRQRPLHVAFTAQEPVAYQLQGLIGLKSASLPQHEMLADAGELGQNAKNSMRLASKKRMDHRNGTIIPLAHPCGRSGRLWRDIVASFPLLNVEH